MTAGLRELIAATAAAAEAEREAAGRQPLRRPPLAAAASAGDGRFAELRAVAAADHLLPADLLAGARSVVAFFLPFNKTVALSNREGRAASALWAEAYIDTNALIARIAGACAARLEALGFRSATVAATHNFDPVTLLSRWSHRHVGRIAGLGDFGLNNMLITKKGAAGRFGSFVTDAPAELLGLGAEDVIAGWGADFAGPRSGGGPRPGHPCGLLRDGSCGLCVARCPAGALRIDGFDRQACYALCLENAERHRELGYADVCGKCLSGVPCAFME